jgi:hypothetical protein
MVILANCAGDDMGKWVSAGVSETEKLPLAVNMARPWYECGVQAGYLKLPSDAMENAGPEICNEFRQ